MKGINLTLTWFGFCVCSLAFSLLLLVYISFPQVKTTPLDPRYQMYKALPNDSFLNQQIVEIGKSDARALIIANFFKDHNAPLANYAQEFIEVSQKYNLDYRLLPAIAMQESNGGKRIPKDSFNPFGYGIYGGKVLHFSSFGEAIEKVGEGLRKNYLNSGLETPEQIMPKYTPPSLLKGGAWALGVSAFMEQLN
ncbi:MAG: hypothetical protein V1808_04625 [Candidatus Daviesbacteria bacterium]